MKIQKCPFLSFDQRTILGEMTLCGIKTLKQKMKQLKRW